MRTLITKEFDFDAAHQLNGLPKTHKCSRLHGHTYRVVLGLEGEVSPKTGWFIDYADVAKAWKPLDRALDHRFLNDIPGLSTPTTENLAAWIAARVAGSKKIGRHLVWVRVYESCTTYCQVWI
jgi:6-pyruvoyltetrahydropterin/6-carboxytetrahydropterin synthase